MAESERRRSDRVMLTMPLRVQGKDRRGKAFDAEGRTIVLSRYGACLHTRQELRYGQVISLYCQTTMRRGSFRVVGPTEPYTAGGGEWAVEAVDPETNLWGIRFPPLPEGEDARQKALLECRQCQQAALLRISLEEVDVLETAGIIQRQCPQCSGETPWGYATQLLALETPPREMTQFDEVRSRLAQPEKSRDRRKTARVALQLSLFVRDYYGHTEVTKTENVSKKGLCFVSPAEYLLGQGLAVICPYNPNDQTLEMKARVVRREEVAALGKHIYGVRYEAQRKK